VQRPESPAVRQPERAVRELGVRHHLGDARQPVVRAVRDDRAADATRRQTEVLIRLRWGLVGAGDIAKRRGAPALRDSPLSQLLAISRARPELADEARALGADRWYPRWQDLVTDRDVQSVYVATPVHPHAHKTIAAPAPG